MYVYRGSAIRTATTETAAAAWSYEVLVWVSSLKGLKILSV
jgi:hypothetical protein